MMFKSPNCPNKVTFYNDLKFPKLESFILTCVIFSRAKTGRNLDEIFFSLIHLNCTDLILLKYY